MVPVLYNWLCAEAYVIVIAFTICTLSQPDTHTSEWRHYRPQTKFAKVMFLHLSVSHSVHRGGGASVHAGSRPTSPGADPLGADTPPGANTSPSRADPLGADIPPGADTPCAVHAGRYGQQSGRYTSYWNAYLLFKRNYTNVFRCPKIYVI